MNNAIDLNSLKTEESIIQLAAQIGFDLKSNTGGAVTNCPICREAGQSRHLYLYQESNRFHCFKCQAKGTNIDLLMATYNIDTKAAIEKLKDMYQWKYTDQSGKPHSSATSKPIDVKKTESETVQDYSEIYQAFITTLRISDRGRNYLSFIRAISDDVIDRFNIVSMDYPQNTYSRLKDQFPDDELKSAGLISKSSTGKPYFSFFKPCIVFPHKIDGKIVYLSIRNYDGEPKCFKLPGIKSISFIGNCTKDKIILFEGIINALSYYQLTGDDSFIALGGLLSLEKYQALVESYPGKRLILALDPDAKGKEATAKLVGSEFLNWDKWSRKFKGFSHVPTNPNGKQWDMNDFLVYYRDNFEERVAIMEYDGCLDRVTAEAQAKNCILS